MTSPSVEMDPRVAAIMAKLEGGEEVEEEKKKEKPEPKPPSNLEEFMKAEEIEEWPQRLTSEGPLDIQSEVLLLGTKDDIVELLRDAAPFGLHVLEELEERLHGLEIRLNHYATQIVTDEKRQSRLHDRLFYSPSRTFMTEVSESDAVRSHHSSKGHKSLEDQYNMKDFVESLMETRKKSLEYCIFPGFRHGELIELPGQLESPPILHRVTKAQDFNPGFRKFWKKLFLSEASVAVMQDSFWWWFLHKYDGKQLEAKDQLYDRIADSFVALFTSINKDVKDKFLSVYPDCLSQAIFSAYWEAFPESRNKFDDEFRQELVNFVHEWVTGLRPVPGTWKSWKVKRLQSKPPKGLEKETSKTAEQMMHAAALNKEMDYSLDIETFYKIVDKLGLEQPQVAVGQTPMGMSRDVTRLTNVSAMTPSLIQGGTTISQSRLATAGTPFRKPTEAVTVAIPEKAKPRSQTPRQSHQLGPGPEYERVKFNTQGRSPLISHYLYMRQLRDLHQPGKQVRRTEIAKLPPPGPTYRQLIQNTLAMSDALSKEYQKICEQTDQEINDLERRQRDTNREFNQLTRELMLTKNPLDLRILSDRIIGMKDKERDTPLLDKGDQKGKKKDEDEDSDSD